jgi:hypothetical protein
MLLIWMPANECEETDPQTRAEGEVNTQIEGAARFEQAFYYYIFAIIAVLQASSCSAL